MKPKRIFIAVDISDAARAECVRHIHEMRRRFPSSNVRWERAEKLHLTLKFLGNTEDRSLAELQDRLGNLAKQTPSFMLMLNGVGIFPSRQKPRVLWVGSQDYPDDSLRTLAAGVEDACEQLGYERESRRFAPHLTIGRVRPPFRGLDVIEEHLAGPIEPVEFDVTSLTIYQSELRPNGSLYSVVSRLQLGEL